MITIEDLKKLETRGKEGGLLELTNALYRHMLKSNTLNLTYDEIKEISGRLLGEITSTTNLQSAKRALKK